MHLMKQTLSQCHATSTWSPKFSINQQKQVSSVTFNSYGDDEIENILGFLHILVGWAFMSNFNSKSYLYTCLLV